MRSLIKPFLRGLCRILFRVRVEGLTRDIESDRLLVVANHESFHDGLLLGLFLPIDPVFVVHTGVANDWFFRLLLSQVDYLAVDPTSPMAMKKVIRLLETGRPVVIFPEGRITTTGSLMKVYDGPAFVAAKTGAKVLPVRLAGPSRSYFSRVSGKHPRVFFPKVRVSILPSTTIPMPDAPSAKLRRRRAGEAMRRLMQEMVFASGPEQTLYSALCDASEIFGGRRRLLEDVKHKMEWFGWMSSVEGWVALITLVGLEIVLGVDNIIFISILVGRLPPEQRNLGRRLGLGFAMLTRILLLLSITWVMRLTSPLLSIMGKDITGRDLILIGGGLFLLWKSVHEIHESMTPGEDEDGDGVEGKARVSFAGIIVQIAIIDIVFSLDSVITAVGMVGDIAIMIIAVVASVGVVMFAAKPIGEFVDDNPTIKILALSFLTVHSRRERMPERA